jgi:hypothetical protein
MAGTDGVVVEFFGVPRLRAGCAELLLPPGSVGQLLAAIESACPALKGLRTTDGRPAAHYLLSLDGRAFVADPDLWVAAGERLLLLSADAGG